ncbi:MAG: response regulator [Desulfobacterales bacterium]|nr:response regulator [Desulfobacterales bacterium]
MKDAIAPDSNDSKRVAEALRESEQINRMMIEHAVSAFAVHEIVLDDAGRPVDYIFLSANPAFETHTGLRVADVVGRRAGEVLQGTENNRLIAVYGKVALTGEPVSFEQYSEILGRHYFINAYRVGDRRFATAFIDITAQKQVELKLRDSEERFRSLVATMSHEIRTPMNAVIGLSKLLLATRLDAQQRDYLNNINGLSRMSMGIINDILDYSKIEAGKLNLDHHCFRLDEVLERMKDLFASAAVNKRLKLVFRVSPDIPRSLVGDALRLGQVLTNLLGNALKFTEHGQIELKITRRGGDDAQVRLRFEVIDTGIGLDADQIGRLFQAFSQADSSTTRKYGGTGLGLAISSKLVEVMGGALKVESAPGQGCNFFFELTLSLPGEADALEGPGMLEAIEGVSVPPPDFDDMRVPSFAGASILLVEDKVLNQEVTIRWLEKTGARITLANNGAEALKRVDEQIFHLILMDLQMPVMDGFAATRRIRKRYPDLPVVALSAAVMPADRQKAREAGMNAHLAKPIDEVELYQTLSQWLGSADAAIIAQDLPEPRPGLPAVLEGFDLERGLRSADGDAAFYHRLLHHFKDQLNGEFAVIADLLEQKGQKETGARMVHALKGIARTVGHVRLANITVAIDLAFKEGKEIGQTLRREMRLALTEARAQMENLPPLPDATGQVGTDEGWASMHKLLALLRNSELVEEGLLAAVTHFVDSRLGPGASDALRKHVERFEQDVAAGILVALAAQAGEKLI